MTAIRYEATGTVESLRSTSHGFGDSKQVGFEIRLDLPFGSAVVSLPSGIEAPKLGDEFRLVLVELNAAGLPELLGEAE